MTRALNIYGLSRIHEEVPFNTVEKLLSQKDTGGGTHFHEIESLRILVDALVRMGMQIKELDGFFFRLHDPADRQRV